jgi:hypothetical protein
MYHIIWFAAAMMVHVMSPQTDAAFTRANSRWLQNCLIFSKNVDFEALGLDNGS